MPEVADADGPHRTMRPELTGEGLCRSDLLPRCVVIASTSLCSLRA